MTRLPGTAISRRFAPRDDTIAGKAIPRPFACWDDTNRRSTIADEKSGWAAARDDVPIDRALLADLLDPWARGRAVSQPVFLRGGLMNRNYRVGVGGDDVVLRFYDRTRTACAKETAILQAVAGVVAAPRVLYAEPDADPTPFAVLEYVDGISLRELKARGDGEALASAAYDVGRQLAALGSVAVGAEVMGVPGIDPTVLAGSNVNARLIEHFVESPTLRTRLSESDVERVVRFAWHREELLAPYSGARSIVHGDLNSPNVLVGQSGASWIVSAIIDWEFAFAGHVFYDIGNFLRYERQGVPRFEPWFSRGLADGGVVLPTQWLAMARVADLGALCELLTRTDVPDNVVHEIRGLILATLDENSPPETA
jgi:aminoglycoside phosphotransferase (APT) family kinase protein